MKFTEYIIENFSKPITALADRPRMSAQELKEWFDSNSTNEIKNSVNGIATLLNSINGASNIGCKSYKNFGENLEEYIQTLATRVIVAQTQVDDIREMVNRITESAIEAKEAAKEAMMYAKHAADIADDMNYLILIDPESGKEMGIQEILYNLYYRSASINEITCDLWDSQDWDCEKFDNNNFTCREFDLTNIFE